MADEKDVFEELVSEDATGEIIDPTDDTGDDTPGTTDDTGDSDTSEGEGDITDDDLQQVPEGLRKRFSKLTGRIKDQEKQIAEMRQSNMPSVEPPKAPALPDPPNPMNFDTHEEYEAAMTDYPRQVNQWHKDTQTFYSQQTLQQRNETIRQGFKSHVDKELIKNPGFQQVLNEVPVSGAEALEIMQSEKSIDIVHYLHANPHEALRIQAMSPIDAKVAIARIEERVKHTRPAKQPSKAPKPAPRLSGDHSGGDLEDVFDENMSTEERIAKWRH